MQKILILFSSLILLLAVGCENPGIADKLESSSTDQSSGSSSSNGSSNGQGGGGGSKYSISGMKASRCGVAGQIHLSWNSVNGADSYRIFRYTQKKEGALDRVEDTTNVVYDDINNGPNNLELNTPYFYKVAAIVGGVEQEKSASFELGMYSSVADAFENNDDYSEVSGDLTTDKVKQAVLFSSPDGLGNVVGDTDWYRYSGTAERITFEITIPDENVFSSGEVKFQFYYDGQPMTVQDVPIGTVNHPFSFSGDWYNAEDKADNEAEVYCKVWVDTGEVSAANKVQSYTVKLIKGF